MTTNPPEPLPTAPPAPSVPNTAFVAGTVTVATLPVIEETLTVVKREVDRGGWRVTRRIETHERVFDEALREQRVDIERRPIGRRLEEGEVPQARHEGDTLVIPVLEQVVVTQTHWVLTEEVRVTRVSATHRRPQTVTLHRQEVSIEPLAAGQPPADDALQPLAPTGRASNAPSGQERQAMSTKLVGMFDTEAAAEQARTKLMAAGFAADAVALTAAPTAAAAPGGARAPAEDEGVISRFFSDLFGTTDDRDPGAATYREAFRRGSFALTVTAADEAQEDKAQAIMNAAGAVDIDERSQQWRQEGWKGAPATAQPVAGAAAATAAGAATLEAGAKRTVQEVEEELAIGKRAVARGGVRVFSRIIETPVEESVMLREEQAHIERRTVDRPATAEELAAFKEGSLEVRAMAEEAVVSKTARVTGEVDVSKTTSEREEVVRDTVRKTKVDVEQIAPDATRVDATPPAKPKGSPGR